MRKAENPDRDGFRVCAAESEREDALIFDRKSEVPVKGVHFCFPSQTELGTDSRVGKSVHDSAIWWVTNATKQKWLNNFKIAYMGLDGEGL